MINIRHILYYTNANLNISEEIAIKILKTRCKLNSYYRLHNSYKVYCIYYSPNTRMIIKLYYKHYYNISNSFLQSILNIQ